MTDWRVGRRRRRRADRSAAARCAMCLAGRPSLCVRAGHPGHRPASQGAFATYKVAPAGELLAHARRASTPGPRPWPSRWPWPLHGIHQGGVEPGHRVLVLGAGPIGALSIAALRAIGRRRRRAAPSPASGARRWPPPSAPPRCCTPTTSWCRPSPSRRSSSTTPSTSCSSAPARPGRWRPASPSSSGAGTLVLVGAGIEPPRFDPNRILLNELVDHRAPSSTTHDGFERGAGPAVVGRAPRRRARSSPTTSRSTACSTPCATSPTAAWPERCWCGHDGARRSPSRRGSTTSPCRVPADALDADGRAAINAFYGDVFGFEEYEDLTKDRQQLVLRAHSHEQFVFLIADDQPMTAPRLDHFGMSVATLDDFEEVARRAAAWKAKRARRGRPHRADASRSTSARSACTASTCATASPSWWRPSTSSTCSRPALASVRARKRS